MFHSSRRIKFIRIFCIDERGNNHSCSLVNREERGGDTSIVVGTRGRRWKANVVANLFVEARRERRHPLQISSSDVYAIRSCRPTLFCRRRNRAQEPLIFVFITSRCDVISWGKEDGITSSPYPTDTAAVIPLFEWSQVVRVRGSLSLSRSRLFSLLCRGSLTFLALLCGNGFRQVSFHCEKESQLKFSSPVDEGLILKN